MGMSGQNQQHNLVQRENMRASCSQVISSKWQELILKATARPCDSTDYTLLKVAMARTDIS